MKMEDDGKGGRRLGTRERKLPRSCNENVSRSLSLRVSNIKMHMLHREEGRDRRRTQETAQR